LRDRYVAVVEGEVGKKFLKRPHAASELQRIVHGDFGYFPFLAAEEFRFAFLADRDRHPEPLCQRKNALLVVCAEAQIKCGVEGVEAVVRLAVIAEDPHYHAVSDWI
jgi:hypothetical protein